MNFNLTTDETTFLLKKKDIIIEENVSVKMTQNLGITFLDNCLSLFFLSKIRN